MNLYLVPVKYNRVHIHIRWPEILLSGTMNNSFSNIVAPMVCKMIILQDAGFQGLCTNLPPLEMYSLKSRRDNQDYANLEAIKWDRVIIFLFSCFCHSFRMKIVIVQPAKYLLT